MTDSPIYMVLIQRPGMPGTGITELEKNQITSDIAEALGRVNVTQLDDVPGVSVSAPIDGDAVVYDAGTNTWNAGPVTGAIPLVRRGSGTVEIFDVETLETGGGLLIDTDGADPAKAIISAAFGGTGASTGVARSDHNHLTDSLTIEPFGPTGYLSGSSRALASRNVTLQSGIEYMVKARLRVQLRGADANQAFYTMSVGLDGNTRTSTGGANGYWCVQGVPNKETWTHSRVITGTGASITVTGSVAYHSGAGFNIDAGELEIELSPNR